MKQKCPPNAWKKFEGGLTYKFVEESIKPNLIQMCIDAGAENTEVQFDWYLPPTNTESASGAVRMVCHGDFQNTSQSGNTTCEASGSYKGASNVNECMFRDDLTCLSSGPDIVAGAVHVLRERLDLLDFSSSYFTVRQITVKRGTPLIPDFMKTFKCFDETLWFIGLFMEIAVVWVLILLVETWKNPQIDKSNPIAPFYDSLYWSFGSALDPGGPGKAPFTAGGRIFMCGHWFYLTIMAATYTGVLGPFLISSSEAMVTGFHSLQQGHHTVVVRGPKWDDKAPEPDYKGSYRGGIGQEDTPRSTQFKLLQNVMNSDSKVKFNIATATSLDSFQFEDGIKKPLLMSKTVDPCTVQGAQLGAFDLVYCGEQSVAQHKPDAMIFDAPSVYYEIRKRKDALGKCPLLTVGEQFFTSGFALGFPKNNHYSRAFSVAIQKGVQNGTVGALEKEFNISGDGFPW